ncbi:HAD family hydrolase [Microbacterium oxydans]|uniref:HAD family hydrolase n=1 Tax=Microbacterium sp. B19(2022) TaxID=2914045 RepID=UPI0014318678|nr:HAD family hydrolase [Microbacterium sp. B19(2022)]NJI60243.1 HAD family hydrolase [Microbacterium sp. B19(2022)]
MIRVVLFDLDGVIRHFDPAHVAEIERRHGLDSGIIAGTAFAAPLIDEVTTGRITRAEWVRRIGERIGNAAAATEWGAHPAMVDGDVLDLSDELRAAGLRTAVLTNGTDTLPAELAAHGISDRFDAVFNSADIGFAKPDARAFQHVLGALEVSATEVFFTDDSAGKLVGAESLSMHTNLFAGVDDLRAQLIAAGVGIGRPAREVFEEAK